MAKRIHKELRNKLHVSGSDSRGVNDIVKNNEKLKNIANVFINQDQVGSTGVRIPKFDSSMNESNKNMEELVLLKEK